MLYSDDIIERNQIRLKNLNTNALNTATDVWSGALTGYGFYSIPYEVPLGYGRYYYYRAVYKFTTTNQSPTWVAIYSQDGSVSPVRQTSLTANTEYTLSVVAQPSPLPGITVTSGTLYNGDSSKISGVSSYVKNVLCYDVTELYSILKAKGVVTTVETLKTWCDTNLVHVPKDTYYDITSLVENTTDKTIFDKGNVVAEEFIEGDGMTIYSVNDSVRNNVYFDNGSGISVYNNSGGNTVTLTRVSANTVTPLSPFYPKHATIMKIVTNGTASPGAGGFLCSHTAKANGIFVEKFVALVPTGYTVNAAANSQGTGGTYSILGNNQGTGKWEEYTILYKCGSSGSFSNGGHVYISGSNNTSVTWYVAYVNNCDITGKEYLKGYTTLPKKISMGGKYLFANEFNCRDIFPNGNIFNQETAMLPSGWTYDATDYAGNAKCSIVQPVNANAGSFGVNIPINPMCKYKISFWVKCKADMTSFLTAIYYLNSNGTVLSHNLVMYKSGTMTQLSAALKSGDTTVTVKSNANWASRSYSKLGFRSSPYKSFHDISSFNNNGSTGIVSGVSGTTVINLAKAYSGNTIPVNTYIVEGYNGCNYPYPIQKGNLPTNNTWKYVEGYFGKEDLPWDGNDNIGSWGGNPVDAVKISIGLNIYQNTGSVPIKYSDIRVEVVNGTNSSRKQDKIQIGG